LHGKSQELPVTIERPILCKKFLFSLDVKSSRLLGVFVSTYFSTKVMICAVAVTVNRAIYDDDDDDDDDSVK
jgi:hypothetical protein